MKNNNHRNRHGFTLIELLVVVAIISMLIAILLPSLSRAREQTKSVLCLSNLRTLAQGVITFASEADDKLPGGLHPAVYKNQGIDALMHNEIRNMTYAQAKFFQERFLSYQLRRIFNDSDSQANSITDEVATCPVMEAIVPDSHFVEYSDHPEGKPVYPLHYVLNNVGIGQGTGAPEDDPRTTTPAYYFGYSANTAGDPAQAALESTHRPKPLAKIERSSEEWMIADAWFRPRVSNPLGLRQEGPYQVSWSGYAMPNFAPHFAKRKIYAFDGAAARRTDSARVRQDKADGWTNTAYFDGHAAPVESKTLSINGFEVLYGFPGTINPDPALPNGAIWR